MHQVGNLDTINVKVGTDANKQCKASIILTSSSAFLNIGNMEGGNNKSVYLFLNDIKVGVMIN